MPTSASLLGRTALVTGGASGIGAAVAEELAGRGATVVVADLDLDAATRTARSLPGDALARHVDLADPASTNGLAASMAGGPGCDVLVHAAGVAKVDRFLNSDPADWDAMYAVNQRAPMQLTQALLPPMLEKGWGRIVLIGSDSARVGAGHEAAYAATKAALSGFAKSLAREVARRGVTVNLVCPGPTDTPMLRRAMAGREDMLERLVQGVPLGRLADPSEVADAVGWLAGPRAGFVTGQVVSVSGGVTMQ